MAEGGEGIDVLFALFIVAAIGSRFFNVIYNCRASSTHERKR